MGPIYRTVVMFLYLVVPSLQIQSKKALDLLRWEDFTCQMY